MRKGSERMSKSVLHDWECAIERTSGNNANEMFDIAQDIYNTGYVRGKNAMSYVIDDIKAEIDKLDFDFGDFYDHTESIHEMIDKVWNKHTGKERVNFSQGIGYLVKDLVKGKEQNE